MTDQPTPDDARSPGHWVAVVAESEVTGPPWSCYEVDGVSVRLVRDAAGSVRAVAPACPHLDAPLDRAVVGDGVIECPRHFYAYDLVSGANRVPGLSWTLPLPVWPVEVRDGVVHVELRAGRDA
jgi:nitrite reductase/ring-hydroxylating ferredoxin subunit